MRNAAKRRITVLATALSVLLVAGVAFAAWTSTGSGTGSADATTQDAPTVSQTGTLDDLYPGKDDVILTINVDSLTNDYKTAVTALTVTDITSDTVGCAGTNIEVADRTAAAGERLETADEGHVIAPNGAEDYELLVDMIDSPADACQGATFTVDVDADLESAEHSVAGQNS